MERRRSRQPHAVELFEELYHYVAASTEMVGQVLAGHLAIEFLLRKLVSQYDPKLTTLADELSHARLITLARDVGVLSTERAHVLIQINALRNRYAHAIRYYPEVAEILAIFTAAERAFTDYSNGIKEGLVALGSATSFSQQNQWLLAELFLAIVYDLHREYVARGGDEERP